MPPHLVILFLLIFSVVMRMIATTVRTMRVTPTEHKDGSTGAPPGLFILFYMLMTSTVSLPTAQHIQPPPHSDCHQHWKPSPHAS
jgi:hypothetical protein